MIWLPVKAFFACFPEERHQSLQEPRLYRQHLLPLFFLRKTSCMKRVSHPIPPSHSLGNGSAAVHLLLLQKYILDSLNFKSSYVSLSQCFKLYTRPGLSSRSRVIISPSWRIIAHGWVMTTIIYGNGLIEWNHWTTRRDTPWTPGNLTVGVSWSWSFCVGWAATHSLLEKTSSKVFFVLPFSSSRCCIGPFDRVYAIIDTWTPGSWSGCLARRSEQCQRADGQTSIEVVETKHLLERKRKTNRHTHPCAPKYSSGSHQPPHM